MQSRHGRSAGPDLIAAVLLAGFATLVAACGSRGELTPARGDPRAGAVAITRRACGSCHAIAGIPGADGRVGPPLARFASRKLIAGRIPNSLEGLRRYLDDPQSVDPGNAMPDQGLTDREIRDIAAWLESRG